MKKALIFLTFAVTLLTLGSCASNKATLNVTSEQKEALVASGLMNEADFTNPVFIDFNATWCGPCRQFAPYFEAAAKKYTDRAKFISVDVDVYGEVAQSFGVESIPTVIALVPSKDAVVYVGTQDIIGDGVFESIVDSLTK